MSEIRMTEQELRTMVREAIARQATGSGSDPAAGSLQVSGALLLRSHASHGLLPVPSGDGPCLIEPAVMCNHCGYCKSYGH